MAMIVKGINVSFDKRRGLLMVSPPDWKRRVRGVQRTARSWRAPESARNVFEEIAREVKE
jgi:hypothetical protein